MSAITAKASRIMKKYAVLTREPRCFLGSFDFSWEQRKAKEICSIGTGKSNTQDQVDDGKYPFYIRSDVPVRSNKYLYDCEAVITIGDGNIGKVFHYVNGKFDLHQRCYKMTDFKDIWGKYFFYYFSTKFYDRAMKMTAKATVDSVRLEMISEMDIKKPPQISEQKQIAEFFANLDNLITLHQRKCANLCSPSQVVFSLLFATSTFSWEQRKVSDLAEKTYGGGTPTTSNEAYWNGDIPWIQSSDVVDGKLLGVEPRKWITQDGLNNSAAQLIPGNSIAIITRVGVGKLAFMPYSYATSQDFLSLSKLNAEPLFTVYACYKKLQSELNAVQGTSIKGITKDELLAKSIMVPRYAEQQQIGAFFKQLDHLITLHQRECISFTGRADRLILTANKKRTTSSWEQRKFDEVFDCTVPNNTLSRAELSYDEGTVLNVHYGDVLIKYGSVLDVQKDDIPRIPHRCREDFNGALLQDGDVIIADTAEDETTGKACEIGNLQGSAIVSGLHTMVCRPRNRMALGYLGYYLNSNAYHHQLLPLMQGIKVLSLSRSNIQKTSVSYPIAVKEQQLIAYYFSQLDHLITLHQRKPFLMKWRTSDANRNQTNRLVL